MKVLSKSKFKLALECPNKLFYTSNKEYANKKQDDTFLQALAEGGFQVEELARMYYPGGIFIDAPHYAYEEASELTRKALQEENVIIYEAAFLLENLFIRTDILVKSGDQIRMIEVKAKSFNPADENLFIGARGDLKSKWKPYLFDLAFQKYVAQKSYPEWRFSAWLMMADKSKKASIDGLNQMFRIPKDGDPRTDLIKKVHSLEETGNSVLSEIDVDEIISDILNNRYRYFDNMTFHESVHLFREAYTLDKYLRWPPNFSACKNCEFKTTPEDEAKGLKSGFKHCLINLMDWNEYDFHRPNAFEIWNFRGNRLMEVNRLFLDQLNEGDVNLRPEAGKISTSERKWIQIEK